MSERLVVSMCQETIPERPMAVLVGVSGAIADLARKLGVDMEKAYLSITTPEGEFHVHLGPPSVSPDKLH